jgi:hypothetical protein
MTSLSEANPVVFSFPAEHTIDSPAFVQFILSAVENGYIQPGIVFLLVSF